MKAYLKELVPILVALGVLVLLASGGRLFEPPAAEGAATVIATIPSGGNGPFDVAVNPGANLVYVANTGSQDLSVLSGAPPFNAATLPLPVGGASAGVAYNPNGNAVFVSDATNDVIMPYLAVAPFLVLGAPIATGHAPTYIAANPANNRIYVSNALQPDIAVFDGTAPGFPFIASLPQPPCAAGPGFAPGSVPGGMAINPTTNQIYVALSGVDQLWVMDGSAPWGCLPPVPVGVSPIGVAYNSSNNHIYVANNTSNNITVIDASTFNVLNPGLPVGANPVGVAVNPSTNRIYVTSSGGNTVSVIDGSTDTVAQTVSVGSMPQGIAVNPLTNLVFVGNYNDNTISVIEDMPTVSPPTPTPTPTVPAPPPPGGMEQLPLQGGTCVPVASTYPDASPIATIAGAVAPPDVLQGLWEFDGVTWLGYSPQFPVASNLTQMDRLDVVFICVSGSGPNAGMFSRPVI